MKRICRIIETLLLLTAAFLCGKAIYERYAEFLSARSFVPSFLLISAILIFGTLFMLLLIWDSRLLAGIESVKSGVPFLVQPLAVVFTLIPGFLYNFMNFSEPYRGLWIRIFVCLFTVVTAAWLWERERGIRWADLIPMSLCFSVGFALMTQFHDVTDYPFSLGWSEGNRIWDYSILFGRDRYNYPADQPIPAYIDLGRQSLWGAIFLFKDANILTMRIWNDILFTLPCALLGWALMERSGKKFAQRLAFGLWAMLFLMQGPIYTPLVLAAILVALGKKLPLPLNCLLTAAAGFYAVMSRSTWLVAPAAFAVFLYFLDRNKDAKTRWLGSAALGISGLAGAGLYLKRAAISSVLTPSAQAETVEAVIEETAAVSEAAPKIFTPEWFEYTISRQPLLWDRLLPNETYTPGILLGLALAVLPLILLVILWSRKNDRKPDFWQKLLIFAGAGIFLLAGLVFSVKIGGGSNLHNLDMFLIIILIFGALAWNMGMEDWMHEKIRSDSHVCLLILAAIVLPVIGSVTSAEPRSLPDPAITADALQKIREVSADPEGEVLFMDQRQLLTFGEVGDVELIPDYEKKWMMDEAMADNGDFFAPYIEDLKAHRFSAIITEPLHIKFQGAGQEFSEENDLFVKWVSLPTLCYYEPYETFDGQGVQILLPREGEPDFEGVTCP